MTSRPWEEEINLYMNQNNAEQYNLTEIYCPFCHRSNPEIVEIDNQSLSTDAVLTFNCDCLQIENKEELPKASLNDYHQFLLEKASTSQAFCFKHNTRIASKFCKKCHHYLCEYCLAHHYETMPNHEILPITKEGALINKKIKPIIHSCTVHWNVELTCYCFDCDVNICSWCAKQNHSENTKHNLVSLKDLWEEISQTLPFDSAETIRDYVNDVLNTKLFYMQMEKNNWSNWVSQLVSMKENYETRRRELFTTNAGWGLILSNTYTSFFNMRAHPNFRNIQNVKKFAIVGNNDKTNGERAKQALEKWNEGIKECFTVWSSLDETPLLTTDGSSNKCLKNCEEIKYFKGFDTSN